MVFVISLKFTFFSQQTHVKGKSVLQEGFALTKGMEEPNARAQDAETR